MSRNKNTGGLEQAKINMIKKNKKYDNLCFPSPGYFSKFDDIEMENLKNKMTLQSQKKTKHLKRISENLA